MGDMADLALDESMDRMELFDELTNEQGYTDALYENGFVDELGYFMGPSGGVLLKTCRCCNRSGLQWGRHDDKWRLFDDGKLHECPFKVRLKQRDA